MTESSPISPHAMAAAALADAMKEHRTVRIESEQHGSTVQDRQENTEKDTIANDDPMERLKEQLEQGTDDVLKSVVSFTNQHVDELQKVGLEVFRSFETAKRDLQVTKEELEAKDFELKRLRVSEEQSRATISKLLRAIETAKVDAKDNSSTVVVEAELRAEVNRMKVKRDEALEKAESSKRKAALLEEELRHTKVKLARADQEKIKMERDQRATLSLARSLDNPASSDCDFYKRKVTELSGQIQKLNAVVSEKNRQMDEMRRQMERSYSQNRLANIRAETASKKRSTSSM